MRRFAALLGIASMFMVAPAHGQASTPVRGPLPAQITQTQQIAADLTRLVQTRLHQYGYSVKIDSVYGPQTTRAVRLWQKANGLTQTGFPNTETLATLGPISFATANHPAVRTSPPEPLSPAGSESAEAVIRSVWPDDLEDWAVRIAYRESRLIPTAHNSCCYGLFSIYFKVHQGWLADYGVYQPSDLYNPETNARVALALYQQAGASPWNL